MRRPIDLASAIRAQATHTPTDLTLSELVRAARSSRRTRRTAPPRVLFFKSETADLIQRVFPRKARPGLQSAPVLGAGSGDTPWASAAACCAVSALRYAGRACSRSQYPSTAGGNRA